MRRFWVKDTDGETVVRTHFGTEYAAQEVADALGRESDGEYHVEDKP